VIACLYLVISTSCSHEAEGLLGEWVGKIERVSDKGKLVESEVSCIIKVLSGINRSVLLTVAGSRYDFEAIEDMDLLTFKDVPLGKDSSVMSYISGTAELRYDTLLHFDHDVYTLMNGALTFSESFEFGLVRK